MMFLKSMFHALYDIRIMKRILYLISSFTLVAAAQPDFGKIACMLTGLGGYTLCWLGLRQLPSKTKFFLAIVWMTGAQMIHTNWMTSVEYVGPGILLGWLLHSLSIGCMFALITVQIEKAHHWTQQLALAGIWVLLEWTRPWWFFGIGFSWDPIGLALTAHDMSLQCASIAGVLGLSFWVMLTNIMCLHRKKVGLCLAIAPYIIGGCLLALHTRPASQTATVRALLLQPAISSPWRHDQDVWETFFSVLAPYVHKSYDLIVFPEGALPHTMQDHYVPPSFMEGGLRYVWDDPTQIAQEEDFNNGFVCQILADRCHSSVIIGMLDSDGPQIYNAAFHFTPQEKSAGEVEHYYKRKLLAFGEYLPRCFAWARYLLPLPANFTAGKNPVLWGDQVPFTVAVCYEETIGELHRNARCQGAKILIGLTNDVWYPHSRLPQAHFYHARVRSVELGMPILRACNTGVTCGISSVGKTIAALPCTTADACAPMGALDITLPIQTYWTPYLLWGDKCAVLGSCLCWALSYCRKKRGGLQSPPFVK